MTLVMSLIYSLKTIVKLTLIKREGSRICRKGKRLSDFDYIVAATKKSKVKMALDVLHRYIRLLLQCLNKY